MFVFDPYWTYYIGSLLKEFDNLNDGDFLGEHVEGIVSVKSDLKRFVAHEQHRVYREGCQCIEGLLEQIEVLLPSNIPFTDRKLELKKDIKPILEHIRETHKAILRDCQNSYILGLEKQRALDLDTLILNIKTAFSELSWMHFSQMTQREVMECGRCLAFERYTASGFHILRALESEIRDYLIMVTHNMPKKRDWGYYIEELEKNNANQQMLTALDNIRNLDRNPLMHPEDWLRKDDAVGLFNLGTTALHRLITDMKKQGLLRPDDELKHVQKKKR